MHPPAERADKRLYQPPDDQPAVSPALFYILFGALLLIAVAAPLLAVLVRR